MQIDTTLNQQNQYLKQNISQILSNASKPVNNLDSQSYDITNPYQGSISDKTYNAFLKASEGFDERAVDGVKKALFESNSHGFQTTALSMLDWSSKAEAIADDIVLPNSNSTKISEFEKELIADQIRIILKAKKQILQNFSLIAKSKNDTSLNMVA